MGANNRVKHDSFRKSVRLDPEQIDFIKNNLDLANASTENEFIKMAVSFYIGSLKTNDAEMYLLRTFSSVLHSALDLSESRINGQLYKMSVELAMLNRIVAYGKNLTEKEIEMIRIISERELKNIYVNSSL